MGPTGGLHVLEKRKNLLPLVGYEQRTASQFVIPTTPSRLIQCVEENLTFGSVGPPSHQTSHCATAVGDTIAKKTVPEPKCRITEAEAPVTRDILESVSEEMQN